MKNYSRTLTTTVQFDGEDIAVTLQRPKREDMLRIIEAQAEATVDGKLDTQAFGVAGMKLGAELLPHRVTALSGITMDGVPVTIEDVCNEGAFLELLGDIFRVFMEAGQISDPKKLAESLPTMLQGSADAAEKNLSEVDLQEAGG